MHKIIHKTISPGKRTDAAFLGLMEHIGYNLPWFRHVYVSIRESFNMTIIKANHGITESEEYIAAVQQAARYDSEDRRHYLQFIEKQKANQIYNNKQNHKIWLTDNFRDDVALIAALCEDQDLWTTPIPHIIPRDHDYTAYCDSCEYGAGGYSLELGFMWHVEWPNKVQKSSNAIKRKTARFFGHPHHLCHIH